MCCNVVQCAVVCYNCVDEPFAADVMCHFEFTVCCKVLRCVAVRCSVLSCVAIWYNALWCVTTVWMNPWWLLSRATLNLQCVAVCCSVLQCVACVAVCYNCVREPSAPQANADFEFALCCSVLQYGAACCKVLHLQCVTLRRSPTLNLHCAAACCSVLQRAAVCCSVLHLQ